MQLQGLEKEGAVARLVEADVDLLVIEAMRTVRGQEEFPTRAVVERIRATKVCLAYINVGQAEDYRTYWREEWRAPTSKERGMPDYLITIDPDGWAGNYPVAYWDFRWKAHLWGTKDALIDKAIADGFDGVYLDWILGYEEERVIAAALSEGIDPAQAMAELVRDLREYAQKRRRGFLVVAQNGVTLPDRVPEYIRWIDAMSHESLSYGGRAGEGWESRGAGDVPNPETKWLADKLGALRDRGLPILTLDYALDPDHIEAAQRRSRALGFVPFVSRAPVDRLP